MKKAREIFEKVRQDQEAKHAAESGSTRKSVENSDGISMSQPEGVVGIPMSKEEQEVESVKAKQACCCVIS